MQKNNLKMKQQHEPCKVKEQPRLYRIGMFANMNRVTITWKRRPDLRRRTQRLSTASRYAAFHRRSPEDALPAWHAWS